MTGLLERVRARFSSEESESDPDPSLSSDMVSGELGRSFREAERVVGGKYESCIPEVSEGVGDGEITRGVPGIGY